MKLIINFMEKVEEGASGNFIKKNGWNRMEARPLYVSDRHIFHILILILACLLILKDEKPCIFNYTLDPFFLKGSLCFLCVHPEI